VSLFYSVDEIVGVVGEDGEIIVSPELYVETKEIKDGIALLFLGGVAAFGFFLIRKGPDQLIKAMEYWGSISSRYCFVV